MRRMKFWQLKQQNQRSILIARAAAKEVEQERQRAIISELEIEDERAQGDELGVRELGEVGAVEEKIKGRGGIRR